MGYIASDRGTHVMSSENTPAQVPASVPQPVAAPAAGSVGATPASDAQQRSVFTPPIDIYEGEEGLVLTADLPGVSPDSLDIQVQDNKLTLFGRVGAYVPAGAKLLHGEFETGDFLRSFILSDEVDLEKISAKLNNGVLEVVLPKAPKTQPRRIQVNKD
jgi:HSP20 family molecular chaperone IbpA